MKTQINKKIKKDSKVREEIKNLQFATNPTETKGLFWRWTEHGLDILEIYINSKIQQTDRNSYKRGVEDNEVDFTKRLEKAIKEDREELIEEIREKIKALEADEGVYEIVEIYNRKIGKITKREWKTNKYYNNAIRDILSLLDSLKK